MNTNTYLRYDYYSELVLEGKRQFKLLNDLHYYVMMSENADIELKSQYIRFYQIFTSMDRFFHIGDVGKAGHYLILDSPGHLQEVKSAFLDSITSGSPMNNTGLNYLFKGASHNVLANMVVDRQRNCAYELVLIGRKYEVYFNICDLSLNILRSIPINH